jgi:hypothetical protein
VSIPWQQEVQAWILVLLNLVNFIRAVFTFDVYLHFFVLWVKNI